MLPRGVRDPQVAIENDRIQIACQYKGGNVQAMLTLEAAVFLTENPNEVGFEIIEAKIGAVGGMTEKAAEALSQACKRTKTKLRWLEDRESPTAIIELPESYLTADRAVALESLDVAQTKLVLP